MSQPIWQERTLPTPDLDLAWYEAGQGPTVVFLSGGPGDDHGYLRPMAEPLAPQFRCVLYDQRGSGRSRLERLDETTLHVQRFFDDIEALRIRLGQERLRLVGHSWGATLALLYAVTQPERVERMALIALGPLNDDLAAVAMANLYQPLSAAEREERAALAAQRKAKAKAGDLGGYHELHVRTMALNLRSWFYSPEVARRFFEVYRSTYAYNPTVAPHVLPSAKQVEIWDRLGQVTTPVLILYGYQDFEPITQAYLLKEHLPQARICLLNECGHVPWLEQPEAFYRELVTFLQQS